MAERFRLIEISYNEVTKQKTVIHLAVTPIEVLYTVSTPVVTLGVTKQTAGKELPHYDSAANIATFQTVKEIVYIHTEQSQHYIKPTLTL